MEVNVDTSARFDIQNIRVGKSWPTLVFARYADKNKTLPDLYPDGAYEMKIYSDAACTHELETIPQGMSLILDDHKIIVSRNAEQNVYGVGTKYFRITMVSDGVKFQFVHGTLNFID